MKPRGTALILAFLMLPALAHGFVEITDISVRPATFSPNGDGVKDSTLVSFTTSSEADSVRLYVSVVYASEDTVAVLAGGEKCEVGGVEFIWYGNVDGDVTAPEGIYVFVIVASSDHYTTPPYSASVRLDLTPPAFTTFIHPSPYAPLLPGADSLLTVEISVTGAEGGDELTASINTGEPPETLCTFSLVPLDSTYSCQWDGRDDADGEYQLSVVTADPAGNASQASYMVDLDLEPPAIYIESPSATYLDSIPETYWVVATDRNGIDSLKVRFYPDTDFMVPDGFPRESCCYAWPESLRIEDEFTLEFAALDGVGYWGTQSKSVVADTTAPQRPVLSPLPDKVGEPLLQVGGTGTALDSLHVYVNGALQKRTSILGDGSFSVNVTLILGPNSIYAVSRDRAGNTSLPSQAAAVEYSEETGIKVAEHYEEDSVIEINLAEEPKRILVRVLSLEGSFIAEIVESNPGLFNELSWDLRDVNGKQVKNGVYVFAIEVTYENGGKSLEKKAVIVNR